MPIVYTKFKAPIFIGLAVLFVAVFPSEWFGLFRIHFFDKVLHLSGGIISAWFFLIFFRKELGATSKLRAIIIIVSIVSLVGVFWEFSEYISSVYVSQIMPAIARYMYIGDLTDTLGDILFDLTGGLSFTILYILKSKFY